MNHEKFGIAALTYPPYEEARNLMSNFLDALSLPSMFFEADTSDLVSLIYADNQNVSLERLQSAWSQMLITTHCFALKSLAANTSLSGVSHWLIVDDDLFISPEFGLGLEKFAGGLPTDCDAVVLAGDALISPLAVKAPLAQTVPCPFPALQQQAAYMVPSNRLTVVADAIVEGRTEDLHSYAYLGVPLLFYQFRDDILPCVLRIGQAAFSDADNLSKRSDMYV